MPFLSNTVNRTFTNQRDSLAPWQQPLRSTAEWINRPNHFDGFKIDFLQHALQHWLFWEISFGIATRRLPSGLQSLHCPQSLGRLHLYWLGFDPRPVKVVSRVQFAIEGHHRRQAFRPLRGLAHIHATSSWLSCMVA
jgi:hypothetical protein